ncbi:MAG: PspC domain-containing protein [Bacillota bacterium]|nr:PspC domain-containing protein [Bacillota bacterium]
MVNRKLYRSTTNRMLGGVCAGIADYFNCDATIIRLVYVALSVFTVAFPGIIVYIIAAIIIPNDPGYTDITNS